MKRLLLAVSFVALAGVAASADPIADREALMKSIGQALGQLAPMAKGEKPFDAAQVQAALATLNERVQTLDVAVLFPPGSTRATVRGVAQDLGGQGGVPGQSRQVKTAAAAAAAAPPHDVAALQAQMGAIGKNCGGCHEIFRVKKG